MQVHVYFAARRAWTRAVNSLSLAPPAAASASPNSRKCGQTCLETQYRNAVRNRPLHSAVIFTLSMPWSGRKGARAANSLCTEAAACPLAIWQSRCNLSELSAQGVQLEQPEEMVRLGWLLNYQPNSIFLVLFYFILSRSLVQRFFRRELNNQMRDFSLHINFII